MYDVNHHFMGSRPIFKPPHVRDTMDDGDEVYKSTSGQTTEYIINPNDDDSMAQETEEYNYIHNVRCKADESWLNINPNEQVKTIGTIILCDSTCIILLFDSMALMPIRLSSLGPNKLLIVPPSPVHIHSHTIM